MLFNSPFNSSPVPVTATEDDISFAWFGLLNSTIRVHTFNPEDVGVIDYRDFPLPENDGSGFVSRRFVRKELILKGNIRGTDKADAEAQLDNFKKNIQDTEWLLKYTTQGHKRQITATCVKISIPRQGYQINVIPFEIAFSTTDSAWRKVSQQTTLYASTSASFSEELSCDGSKDSSPVIYIGFKTGISGTNSIAFACNDRTITVGETIADEDLVIIDCKNKTVTLNGVVVDYTGTFPKFIPGSNYFDMTINGTFSADITFIYPENYL